MQRTTIKAIIQLLLLLSPREWKSKDRVQIPSRYFIDNHYCEGQIMCNNAVAKKTLEMRDLYTDIDWIDGGDFGQVFKLFSDNAPDRVLKVQHSSDNEFAAGLALREDVVRFGASDAFVKVFDKFECDINEIVGQFGHQISDPEKFRDKKSCIIMEFIDGMTLDQVLPMVIDQPVRAIVEFVRSVMFQVFHALHVAHARIKFMHNDLHRFNVMLVRLPESNCDGHFELAVGDQLFRIPHAASGFTQVKLVDYGEAGIQINGKTTVSKRSRRQYHECNNGRVDFIQFFIQIMEGLGRSLANEIDQESDFQFSNLDWLSVRVEDEPEFWKIILNSELFQIYAA
jgi:hypothetical protein